MDFWHSQHRPYKEKSREHLLQGLGWQSHSLWMPGEGGHCINSAYAKGIVDQHSNVALVERDAKIVPLINQRVIEANKWNNAPHLFPCELAKVKLPWPLTFMFADFNGGIDKNTAKWFQEVEIAEGGTVCITHATSWRGNSFLQDFYEAMRCYYPPVRHQCRISDDLILTPIVLAQQYFNKYDFTVSPPMKYRDKTVTMILYKFENFTRLKTPRQYREPKRQLAAMRAWA